MSTSIRLPSSRFAPRRAAHFTYGRALVATRLHSRAISTAAPRKRMVTQMGLFGLGAPELLVIAGVAALIFGPSKLPELGKGLGKTMKEVQSAAKEFQTEMQKEMETEESEGEEITKEKDEPVTTAGSTTNDPNASP